jgi:hypothetical protein
VAGVTASLESNSKESAARNLSQGVLERCVFIGLQLPEDRAEILCLERCPQSNTAILTIQNVRMFGKAQVVLKRGECPQPMQRYMVVVRQEMRHASSEDNSFSLLRTVIGCQPPHPDISITHRVLMILKHQGILFGLRGILRQLSVDGRPHQFLAVVQ